MAQKCAAICPVFCLVGIPKSNQCRNQTAEVSWLDGSIVNKNDPGVLLPACVEFIQYVGDGVDIEGDQNALVLVSRPDENRIGLSQEDAVVPSRNLGDVDTGPVAAQFACHNRG